MSQTEFLAERFEQNRDHLRAVAYRMLGSFTEAEDAVQEAWLRLSRTDDSSIDNLGGWLTTVVARVCLDMLRARNSRREDELDEPSLPAAHIASPNPEQEALLANSVGIALLIVLDRLAPAERLAFVLHDMFDLSFEEISSIIGRSPVAARQLASRARKRVRGESAPKPAISAKKRVVDAFLAALRAGDFNALVSVLDPNLLVCSDATAATPALPTEVRGAEFWARHAIKTANGARAAHVALINGEPGLIIAPRGRLFRILRFHFADARITEIDVIGDRAQLDSLDLTIF